MNGNNYTLEQDSIELDDENYYNFTLTHNSEFWLLNGNVDKLEKVSMENKEEVEDNKNNNDTTKSENNVSNNTSNPRTGDNIILFVSILAISVLGIIITLKIRKNYAE